MSSDVGTILRRFTLADAADILIVALVLYFFFLLIKETRAYQMAVGIGLILALYLATRWGKLVASNWLIRNFLTYLIIAVIVLFQGEIRRFLSGIGAKAIRKPLALRSLEEKIGDLSVAVSYMSQKRIGALIAIENEISLDPIAERGTPVDAVLSKDLLVSLFFPHSPLHDGAVVIRGGTIIAAGCVLPLPASYQMRPDLQARTRHLAALGLSQETDAAIIVVSEETGRISLAARGDLLPLADPDELRVRLLEYLKR